MRLKIISCAVMRRELRFAASRSPNSIDIEFVDQGLHEFPNKLQGILIKAISGIRSKDYDFILLNYGLCGKGTLDLSHSELPVVMHNCSDCIPLLLGDKQCHIQLVEGRPGIFWYSYGWIEGFPLPGGSDYPEKYRKFYGRPIDEGSREVVEQVLMENYTHLACIYWEELGQKMARSTKQYTRECQSTLCNRLNRNLEYEEHRGSPDLLERFVNGEWDSDDFLFIEPGKKVGFDPLSNRLYAR